MSRVRNQYEKWVYPAPIIDMRGAIQSGEYWEVGTPQTSYRRIWPRRRNADYLNILVAGCGSVQAAYYACLNPTWTVTGIDFSENSLSCHRKLKERHGLSNLHLEKLDLIHVDKLGQRFDFIVSTGVLHHLPSPTDGLSALKGVLRPEGVMNLMVYGKTLRLGVYLMQEVFRVLNFSQTKEDIDIVKATIAALSPDHALQRYVKSANDLSNDAAFVDTFLHSQDQAYYVNEVLALTRDAGLEFLSWCDPIEYSLELAVPQGHPLWPRLKNLSAETAAHVCDLLSQVHGTHRWWAAHTAYVTGIQIPFDTDAFYDCIAVPHHAAMLAQEEVAMTGANLRCRRGNYSFEMGSVLAEVLIRAKGLKSIRETVSEMNLSPGQRDAVFAAARVHFAALWRQGHIEIMLPKTAH